jgi:hypothetical protein
MGKRTGGKRGAPYGNTNRLVHGEYSAAALARNRAESAQRSEFRFMEDLTKILWRLHRLESMRMREDRLR